MCEFLYVYILNVSVFCSLCSLSLNMTKNVKMKKQNLLSLVEKAEELLLQIKFSTGIAV